MIHILGTIDKRLTTLYNAKISSLNLSFLAQLTIFQNQVEKILTWPRFNFKASLTNNS